MHLSQNEESGLIGCCLWPEAALLLAPVVLAVLAVARLVRWIRRRLGEPDPPL